MKNRSRIALLIVVLFMLGAVSITAYQSASKLITLVDDGKVTRYETDASSVGELLSQLELTLGSKDKVEPQLDTKIEDDMKITIERWKPTVKFTLDGETTQFKTNLATVGDILKAKGLTVGDNLFVKPNVDQKVEDGQEIIVKTKEIKYVTDEREMSYETKVQESADLEAGKTEVIQEGKNGKKQVTTKQTYVGGELADETVDEVVVTEEPIDEIILKGTKVEAKVKPKVEPKEATVGGGNYAYSKVYDMEATAYTAYSGDGWGNMTASGQTTFVGMVAVDPNVIPLGTKLYVEGYGLALAGDTGGAIKGNKIDLFFNTNQECIDFGRRMKKVYVLKDQNIDVRAARS